MRALHISERNRQSLLTAGVWLGGIWIAWNLAQWIINSETRLILFAAIGVTVAAIALAILKNWRAGFYLFLVWLLFEDLIRKYLGNNMAIFFVKDALAAICYISFFAAVRRRQAQAFRPPFLLFLGLFFWFAFIQVFNPYTPSPFYGLLGLKVDFFYVPLMFVGYALIQSERDLHRFLLVFMVLAVVISGIGIIQGLVGPSFLNPAHLQRDIRELSSLEKVDPLTGQVFFLPCAVFVSSGRFGWYLILAVIVGMGTAAYFVLSSLKGRWLAYVGLGMLAIAIVESGSRGSFLFSIISVLALCAAFVWGAPWKWGGGRRLVKTIRRTIIFSSVGLAAFILIFPSAAASRLGFYSQTLLPSSSAYQLGDRSWTYPMAELDKAFSGRHWLVGNGTGTNTLGAQYVSQILKQPSPTFEVEEGFGQMIDEMGVLAPILWILWSVFAVLCCWKVTIRLKETRFFPLAVAIVWYVFLLLIAMTYMGWDSYQNYVSNAFLWLLIGILYRLPDLASPPHLLNEV